MHHKDLEVWKKSIELVVNIYKLTSQLPEEEKFGLTNQMRRASVSIPSNIAEGCARVSDKESLRFMDIALGSLAELETQLIIVEKLGYMSCEHALEEINNVSALLSGLKKYINSKIRQG